MGKMGKPALLIEEFVVNIGSVDALHKARLMVCARCETPEEASEMLKMLGLL